MLNKGIKYWLLTTEFPPFFGGGISTYAWHTCRMLSEQGYEVTLFLPDNSVSDFAISTEDQLTIVRFNAGRAKLENVLDYQAGLSYAFAQTVLEVITLKGKPDIIEAQDYQGISYYLFQFKFTLDTLLKDIPVLITLHSPAFLYLPYNKVSTYKFPEFWTCEMEKQAIISADHLVSPSKFLPGAIQKHIDLKNAPLSVIPNPFAGSADPEISSGFEKGKVVCYGKLAPQKGTFELLTYFQELWEGGREVTLHLIGGTDIVYHPEMMTMGALVEKRYGKYLENRRLVLHGKVSPKKAAHYVAEANLVVFPSLTDNLPYAVIEMMQLGKVVLASVQGGQSEIITDGQDGYLFDHSIPGNFQEKLEQILLLDRKAIHTIGKKAQKTVVLKYGYGTIFPLKHQLIQKVISQKSKSRTTFPFVHQEAFEPLEATEKNGLLTVVVPYFNMGAFIAETIKSIKACSYKNLQILIIDDGSTEENNIRMLEKLAAEPGIKIIRKKNEGLAIARNVGAESAEGEYLAFLDPDDKVGPNYYEKAIQVLKNYSNVFFVGSWVQYFGNSSKTWPAFTPQPPYLLVHNPVNSSALVYKKAAFLKAGKNDRTLEFGLEDYDSVIGMLAQGYNGVVLPEVDFFYRVRTGSMFRQLNKNKLLYSYQVIADRHPAYFRKFTTEVIHLLNANGPGFNFDNPTETVEVTARIVRNNRLKNHFKTFLKANPVLKNIALATLRKIK